MAKYSNIHLLILTSALALGTAPARAQAPAAATNSSATAEGKVAIVSIQEAIANTNEGKKELDAMQQKFAPRQATLQGQNEEIENMKKQLQAQGDKLSDEERNNRVRTATEKQKSLQRDYEDYQNDLQQAEQDIMNRLGKKMLDVLEKYAKENNYSVIMDVSNPQTPVLYANPQTNITKQLIEAYNTASPVAAPAAKPSATTPRPSGAAAVHPPASGAAPTKKP